MIDPSIGKPLVPASPSDAYSYGHVVAGLPVPKTRRLELFSADDWEAFVNEWASSLSGTYHAVRRFSGAGDKGIDVAAFCTNDWFSASWDNYQCKQYDHPLRPSDIWLEIAKCVYYTSIIAYSVPRRYYFASPRGIGTSLSRLLTNPSDIASGLEANWEKYCRNEITSQMSIELEGGLLAHARSFPYSIFDSVSPVSLIEQHAKTPFHAVRFGGGLPPRAKADHPPPEAQPHESRYISKLFGVYSEDLGIQEFSAHDLESNASTARHFLRQRERFYSAESLKNFARDSVPPGTFEALQDEAFDGIADVCEGHHPSGMKRMTETLQAATALTFSSNPLVGAIGTQDKQGICHQLANDDRVDWLPE